MLVGKAGERGVVFGVKCPLVIHLPGKARSRRPAWLLPFRLDLRPPPGKTRNHRLNRRPGRAFRAGSASQTPDFAQSLLALYPDRHRSVNRPRACRARPGNSEAWKKGGAGNVTAPLHLWIHVVADSGSLLPRF